MFELNKATLTYDLVFITVNDVTRQIADNNRKANSSSCTISIESVDHLNTAIVALIFLPSSWL